MNHRPIKAYVCQYYVFHQVLEMEDISPSLCEFWTGGKNDSVHLLLSNKKTMDLNTSVKIIIQYTIITKSSMNDI